MQEEQSLERLRAICLALPEATEGGGVGDPAFKVRAKIFALRSRSQDRTSVWCKAPAGAQGILVGSAPERFFVPPYVGRYGWIGLWLDENTDWDEAADLIAESYCMTAPKSLRARLDQR